jgi:hypothetical protein
MKLVKVKLLVSRTDGSNRGDMVFVPETEVAAMLAAEQIDPDFTRETVEEPAQTEEKGPGLAEAAPALKKAARRKPETAVAQPATEKATG